ncbi:MBL fold metallo-hydrolase [Waterburya agarophytonicola K14]|uniref:MBL fold metallo-hydrolase n=1 Tax=Waterburya agarophytonicola KI4 TaxID=2874699 RepID=A0A964FFJ9_9CYAN|nr:MBL fold metallo-hydrolase [Waterburya agarophytonicola]MCC0177057.1 MBL fold metallo-hydrolase [Waterburya agarophytonicola KI4]
MNLTYLDSNSWLIEIDGQRILLDPWLVGELTFGNLDWLFCGKKNNPQPIPTDIDLILLSQGLEDHAHPPTLKKLDKQIPVVASPNGTKVVRELGYSTITTLDHGENFQLGTTVEIKAVPGSPIGPTLTENGYIIKGLESHKSIYYEPHGYHDDSLKDAAPIDVIITPITNLKLPLLGAVIKGQETALQVCQWLKPQVILSTAAGGDIDFSGLLMSILKADGSVEEFSELLLQNNLSTKAVDPPSGETIELSLV